MFPTLIQSEIADKSADALAAWMEERSNELFGQFHESGAILFRGSKISSAADFEKVVSSLTPDLVTYVGGGSPRSHVEGKVYTSTEYVGTAHIPLHCEMSYTSHIPRYIWFFCEKKSSEGGETPIGYLKNIESGLSGKFCERLQEKGIRYTTFMHGGNGFGKSWQQTYETESQNEVTQMLEKEGINFEWRDQSLFVERTHPSHHVHSVTGESIWCNQAVNWHPAHLGIDHYEKLLKVFKTPENLPKMAFYGDGEPIDPADIMAINESCLRSERIFGWETGDIIFIDNHRVAHGRQAFKGERRVLAAIGR